MWHVVLLDDNTTREILARDPSEAVDLMERRLRDPRRNV